MVHIKRYKNSRYSGVWIDDHLLAVVCYKKGAEAIKQALNRLCKGWPTDRIPADTLKIEYKTQIRITPQTGDADTHRP